MIRVLFLWAFTINYFLTMAQEFPVSEKKGMVSGYLISDQSGERIPYATIGVYGKESAEWVAGEITDENGFFQLDLKNGLYLIKLNSLGYEEKVIDELIIGTNSGLIELGEIALTENSVALDEVTVTGEKEQVVLEMNRRIFNVSHDLSNAGRSASEILDNIPSVVVDVDGGISLRGSSSVLILVDGKRSGLVGLNNTDGLRNLPGNIIERIEVITNPSSKYEASGQSGIINIILKKEKEKGLNGSFTGNLGLPTLLGSSVSANYRKEWFNVFANYGVNRRETPGSGSSFQRFALEDTSYITRRREEMNRGGISNTIQFGSDFYFNESNILTASLIYEVGDEKNETDITFQDFTSQNGFLDESFRTDLESEDESSLEYNLNFLRLLENDQKLEATLQYRDNVETERANQTTFDSVIFGEPIANQRTFNGEKESQWLLQVDHEKELTSGLQFESGIRLSIRDISNDYWVEDLDSNEGWRRLPGFTNFFNYDEDIYASYGLFEQKIGKFQLQGGLRAEFTHIRTHLREGNLKNTKSYINLFPSAGINYPLKDGLELQVSYSRRIERPDFRQLNPFSSFTDNRNISSGNPDLDPEYTSNYEIGVLNNFKRGSLYLAAYHRNTTGLMVELNRVQEDGTTINQPENLGIRNDYGWESVLSYDVKEWWTINGNINLFRAVANGVSGQEMLNSNAYSLNTRVTSKIDVPKLFEVQTSILYRAPENQPQGKTLSLTTVDLGISKSLLNEKATLAFTIRDLLNSRISRNITEGPTFYNRTDFQWRSRQFTVTFNFRLNDGKPQDRDDEDND